MVHDQHGGVVAWAWTQWSEARLFVGVARPHRALELLDLPDDLAGKGTYGVVVMVGDRYSIDVLEYCSLAQRISAAFFEPCAIEFDESAPGTLSLRFSHFVTSRSAASRRIEEAGRRWSSQAESQSWRPIRFPRNATTD